MGGVARGCESFNTCTHKRKLLHFMEGGGRLCIDELFLGEKVAVARAMTGVPCRPGLLCCCSMGDYVLVMSGGPWEERSVSAAVVSLAPSAGTPQGGEPVFNARTLSVTGDLAWPNTPYLCRVSESRSLVCFDKNEAWYCDINVSELSMRIIPTKLPCDRGFRSVPVPLETDAGAGNLLVVGAAPFSRDITLISACETLQFTRVGIIPGVGRCLGSAILIKERFLFGFGGFSGSPLDDLWIYDRKTKLASPIKQQGDWHPPDRLVVLAEGGESLYLLGGRKTQGVYCIEFKSLPGLIAVGAVRHAFCKELGLQMQLDCAYTSEMLVGSCYSFL